MAITKFVTSQADEGGNEENQQSSNFRTSYKPETTEGSKVSEVKGTTDTESSSTSSDTSEFDEATEDDSHTPMSSPFVSQASDEEGQSDETGESAEAAGTESTFEYVEGWQVGEPKEATADNETLIEASFADRESSEGVHKFFGAIAALLAPMIPTLIKAVAPSVIKGGTKLLGLEGLEVVINVDDRVRIMNTTNVPWKCICHLKIQTTTGKFYLGTGFFIGPRTILTAGHCVYLHSQGGWPKNIVVTPARNGTETPFNTFTCTKFRSVKGWVLNKNSNYNYGVMQLEKSDSVSPAIGAFDFGYYSNPFLLNQRLNTAGYPGDKPAGTMWFNGRKAKAITDRTITYDIDTAGGQSGSPVWFKRTDGKRIVVGVHTNGAATRITKAVFDNIKKWRTEGEIT